MLRKFIRNRRWIARSVNVIFWLIFIVVAFGYSLGGFVAKWLDDRGKRKQAILVYRVALKIYPWNVANNNDLGLTLLTYGDVDGAIIHLRRAVQGAPDIAKYHNHLGVALLHAGKVDDAIHEFEEAVRLAPQYGEYKKNLEKARQKR